MSILASITETVPFVAPWREGDKGAPTFHLRAAGVIERAAMEAELAGVHRAGQVWGYELWPAMESGIATLLADDPQQGKLLEMLAADREHTRDVAKALKEGKAGDALPSDPLSTADRALLSEVVGVLAQHWPPYADLLAQMARRREIAPIVALKRFCGNITGTGVDGKPITFAKGPDGQVSDKTLLSIAPLEMMVAGNRAFSLQYPDGDAEKNFEQPSTSDSDPPTSSSDAA